MSCLSWYVDSCMMMYVRVVIADNPRRTELWFIYMCVCLFHHAWLLSHDTSACYIISMTLLVCVCVLYLFFQYLCVLQ